ncbi:MAG: AMP-binding protein [Bacteroidetes bacterium]|jgi:O-succinylbenzoic acid--CoA ligase|nr:AMP-binding protein [Bacteroidota bacterium]
MFNCISLNGETCNKQQLYNLVSEKVYAPSVPDWEKDVYRFIGELIDKKPYITAYSSGTTGAPKLIKLSKQALINSAKRTEKYFHLQPGDHALLCLPARFIAGKMMIVRAFVTGLNLWLSWPTASPLKNITQSIDFAALTPHQLTQSLADMNLDKPIIKKIIIGGAPVNHNLFGKIQQLPSGVFETYGMTETCSHIAIKSLNGPDVSDWFQLLDGFEIDQDDRKCLTIHFTQDTDQKSIQTNDLVDIRNRSFKWIGRFDNIINSGGIKHSPELIEQKLIDSIQYPFAISAMNDNNLGEKLILVIEMPKPNNSALVTINNLLINRLGHLERPKEIAVMDSFPRTDSGKLKRKELQNLLNQTSNVYFVTLN